MIEPYAAPFTVVMVEDDPGHAALIRRNLQRGGVINPITLLSTGTQAIDYFFPESGAPQDHADTVLMLDLNLPDIDGFEILRRLKGDERTKMIPVVVLTTTDHPKDIDRCYALGCNAFMTKPVGYEAFSEAIRKLGLTLTVVRVPHISDDQHA
ncbi:chemotaxis protein CheY [Asticcacaulis sp. AC460]|uniref:response regulator n=1 Tax=Asticcacaulis sp. AC460 TaxID=1282360 RepID=UPI0003C41124|nr:response regulator [Asticcacaulis sp. AC460]ESQ91580.1 chemotaxis protein CheY [Asticcacaulis sp. AC460]